MAYLCGDSGSSSSGPCCRNNQGPIDEAEHRRCDRSRFPSAISWRQVSLRTDAQSKVPGSSVGKAFLTSRNGPSFRLCEVHCSLKLSRSVSASALALFRASARQLALSLTAQALRRQTQSNNGTFAQLQLSEQASLMQPRDLSRVKEQLRRRPREQGFNGWGKPHGQVRCRCAQPSLVHHARRNDSRPSPALSTRIQSNTSTKYAQRFPPVFHHL